MHNPTGESGRRLTFQLVHPGKNRGEMRVDPAATFQAGQCAWVNPVTGLVELAGAAQDVEGGIAGIFGDTRTTAAVSVAVQEEVIAPDPALAAPVTVRKLNNIQVSPFVNGVNVIIYNATKDLYFPAADIATVAAAAGTDFARGEIDFDGVVTPGTAEAGDVLLITYYYANTKPGYLRSIDELDFNGKVTLWYQQGTYRTTLFEMLDTGAGVYRLPQPNDLLYVTANGNLAPAAGTFALGRVNVGPTAGNPWMEFDLFI